MDEYLPTSQSAKDALEQLSRHSAVTGAAAREIPGVSSKARTDSTPQQSPKEKEHSHVDAPVYYQRWLGYRHTIEPLEHIDKTMVGIHTPLLHTTCNVTDYFSNTRGLQFESFAEVKQAGYGKKKLEDVLRELGLCICEEPLSTSLKKCR